MLTPGRSIGGTERHREGGQRRAGKEGDGHDWRDQREKGNSERTGEGEGSRGKTLRKV